MSKATQSRAPRPRSALSLPRAQKPVRKPALAASTAGRSSRWRKRDSEAGDARPAKRPGRGEAPTAPRRAQSDLGPQTSHKPALPLRRVRRHRFGRRGAHPQVPDARPPPARQDHAHALRQSMLPGRRLGAAFCGRCSLRGPAARGGTCARQQDTCRSVSPHHGRSPVHSRMARTVLGRVLRAATRHLPPQPLAPRHRRAPCRRPGTQGMTALQGHPAA